MRTLLSIAIAFIVATLVIADDANVEIVNTLPAERGGQDVVGTKLPELEFDAVLPPPPEGGRFDSKSPGAAGQERPVTLYRWWTESCPWCEASLPAFEQLRKDYEGKGLRVVAVYHPKPPRPRSGERVVAEASERGFRGIVAVDQDWSELKRFYLDTAPEGTRRRATSAAFLVDSGGIVRFVHPGPVLFASDDPKHTRENADYQALRAAVEVVLNEQAAKAE